MIESTVLIIKVGSEYLLTKRSGHLRNYPNHWVFVGGKIDKNETAKKAAIRECEEEIGLVIEGINVHIFDSCPIYILDNKFKVYVFITKMDSIPHLILNQSEVTDVGLFGVDSTPELKYMTKYLFEILENLHVTIKDD